MKITVRGKGTVNLTEKDYVTEGGEAKVYRKGSTAFKIYSDINKITPLAKLTELKVIKRDNIIVPDTPILNSKDRYIGFTMPWIDNTLPICKLFTTDFRNRNNITPEMIVKLVDNMQESIDHIHQFGVIQCDGNELNYLVKEGDFKTPYFIDVDSYQTPNFPATAIMPNIRDYNTNGFNRLTDWYSFAIIAFQLFIGIHPFKGKNPNFKKNSLIERMKQNVSVFDKDTRVPASTRDFSHIPSHYMAWFERLFQKGERLEPPSIAGLLNVMQVQTEIIDSTDNFIIKFLRDYKNPVTSYFNFSGTDATTTTKEGYIGKVGYDIDNANSVLVFGEKFLTPIIATVADEKLVLTNLKTNVIIPNVFINAKKITKVGNKLFVWQGEKFLEVGITEMNGKVLANVAKTYNVMPNSTQVFDGFLYSTMLEKPYLMISQNGNFVPVPVKELEKYKIIDGKFENGVCVITAYKDGGYDRFTFVFEGVNYTFRKDEDVAGKTVNFTVLSNGIVVSITDDGTMEIFKNDSSHNKMKVINDPAISSDMKLCNNGLEVLFYRGKELYNLKMK